MGLVETEAIVLRTYNLAEADKIVVCLARDSGLIRCVAHGARRLKSRFGAALEPFTVLHLSYYEKEGRELYTLRQAEIERSYFSLAQQAEAVKCLGYFTELLLEFTPPHEPNERLFRMVKACLEALKQAPQEARTLTHYFELWLLRLGGFLPELQECADCRRGLTGEHGYLNAEGRLRCAGCSQRQGAPLSLETQGCLRDARKLSPSNFLQAAREISQNTHMELEQINRRFITRALERELRGRAVS